MAFFVFKLNLDSAIHDLLLRDSFCFSPPGSFQILREKTIRQASFDNLLILDKELVFMLMRDLAFESIPELLATRSSVASLL